VRLDIQADRANDRLTLRRLVAGAPTSVRIDVELAGFTIDRALELTDGVRVVLAAGYGMARILRPYLDRVAVTSFDERLLEELGRFRHVDTTLLFAKPLRVATVARTIGPHHELVTRDLIGAAHALGLRVVPWTVNDVRRMAELFDLGVDGVVTDEPALARAVAGERLSAAA
jgi:glycerophosphoryl diester phosphodiesterase